MRIVPPVDSIEIELEDRSVPASGDWSNLIEQIRAAAKHARDVESKAQEQELRVQQLLEQVRQDLQEARARVEAAEERSRDAQAQADAQVSAAEERTRAAEERAQTAEHWLVRVRDAISAGFFGTRDLRSSDEVQTGASAA